MSNNNNSDSDNSELDITTLSKVTTQHESIMGGVCYVEEVTTGSKINDTETVMLAGSKINDVEIVALAGSKINDMEIIVQAGSPLELVTLIGFLEIGVEFISGRGLLPCLHCQSVYPDVVA